MNRVAPRGEADELARFRRLLNATILATFALIVIGGVVRVSDSGLGCGPAGSGTEGWPLCEGRALPFLELNALIEFSHRVAATIVAVLIAVLALQALRRLRDHRWLVRGSVAAAFLVLAQAGLGGLTVEHGLHSALVAAHLGLAMLLLGGLLYLWRGAEGVRPQTGGPRRLAVAASAAVFCTVVAGGYMAGTQNYGRADYQLGDGAHHACGKEFPSCNGDFMPFGQSRLVDIHLTHRAFMYLASVLLIALIVVSLRRRVAVPYALALIGLLVAQILVGALNVWLDEYEWLIVLHLTLGTLLWATTLGLTLQVSPARERAHGRAEAVAA